MKLIVGVKKQSMKIRIYFLCASVIFLLVTNSVDAQVKKSTSKSKVTANKKKVAENKAETNDPANAISAEVIKAPGAIKKVLDDAGILFKEGLLAYEDNRRSDAGGKFNKSVEVFLYSTLNIRREAILQGCYNQLVETIYRIELPSDNQPPRVQNLAKTCGWTIDNRLAESIAKIVKSNPCGFNSQEFKPSPLDELSKLQLTAEEQQVETDRDGNTVIATMYSRPTQQSLITSGVRVVKAKAGDTVAKVAERYNADPIEVAKYNGLLPDSVLSAGREIRIPPK